MKRWKRILATVLTVAAVLSLMAVNAFALTMDGNTDDSSLPSSINNIIYSTQFTKVNPPRNKLDSTPVYCYIETGTLVYEVYARVFGSHEAEETGVNLTCADGRRVSQVLLKVGTKYSIHNEIYEEGYSFARLELLGGGGGGTAISGKWSPDSYFTYTEAPYSPLIP